VYETEETAEQVTWRRGEEGMRKNTKLPIEIT